MPPWIVGRPPDGAEIVPGNFLALVDTVGGTASLQRELIRRPAAAVADPVIEADAAEEWAGVPHGSPRHLPEGGQPESIMRKGDPMTRIEDLLASDDVQTEDRISALRRAVGDLDELERPLHRGTTGTGSARVLSGSVDHGRASQVSDDPRRGASRATVEVTADVLLFELPALAPCGESFAPELLRNGNGDA